MRPSDPPVQEYGLPSPPQAVAGWTSLLLFLAGAAPAALSVIDGLMNRVVFRGWALLFTGISWVGVAVLLPAGVAFGIVGLCQPHRRREAAAVGLVLNAVAFVAILTLFT